MSIYKSGAAIEWVTQLCSKYIEKKKDWQISLSIESKRNLNLMDRKNKKINITMKQWPLLIWLTNLRVTCNWWPPNTYTKQEMRTLQIAPLKAYIFTFLRSLCDRQWSPNLQAEVRCWGETASSWNHSVTNYCGIICLHGSLPPLSLPQRPDLFS